MNVKIDIEYINWVKNQNPQLTEDQIQDYINEVLNNHKKSWDLEE